MKTHHLQLLLFCLVALFISISCDDQLSGNKTANQAPSTYLFIQNIDSLNPTTSVQTFYWDGRDADGFISGFFYSFETTPTQDDWIWTSERKMTFPLQISGQDTAYIFRVKAIDNEGLEDPTPAEQIFPIKNSAPTIEWQINSNIPDSTFTVASFLWSASDLDGDTTIKFFEYAVDDTSQWLQIEGDRRSINLHFEDGITEGNHSFYIRAVDVAGSKSQIIRMPEDPSMYWYVKEPQGRYLLIDDYAVESSTSGFPDQYYRSMLNDIIIPAGELYSVWNIEDQFPASLVQFTETLLLFERVIWYTDLVVESDPHFIAAQVGLPEFLEAGGKAIYSTQFNNAGFGGGQGNPLSFSPVDSLGQSFNRIFNNSVYYPDNAFNDAFPEIALPELVLSKLFFGAIALKPKATSIPMYRFDDTGDDDPLFIMLGKNDNKTDELYVYEPYDFVFSGTPMHLLDGNNNLNDLFKIIFEDIYGY